MTIKEPIWITPEVILAIHKRQIAEHGGMAGIRDQGLLDAALAKAKNLFAYQEDVDLLSLAAAYGFGIAQNHPFIDGNKRTAYIAMQLFLKLNKVDFQASGEEKYNIMMQLAAGKLTQNELIDWLKQHQKLS